MAQGGYHHPHSLKVFLYRRANRPADHVNETDWMRNRNRDEVVNQMLDRYPIVALGPFTALMFFLAILGHILGKAGDRDKMRQLELEAIDLRAKEMAEIDYKISKEWALERQRQKEEITRKQWEVVKSKEDPDSR